LRFYTIAVFRVEENPATLGWSQKQATEPAPPTPPQEEASEVGSGIFGGGWLARKVQRKMVFVA